jgi:hypothetical protein
MNSFNSNMSYDYFSCSDICGFSYFTDDKEFKYTEDGDICISTDASNWAKKLINNMSLEKYIESEALVPPEKLSFPEFGTRERAKKIRKESVGNYIESCELCNDSLENGTHRLAKVNKLVCSDCFEYAKNLNPCGLCFGDSNLYMFINGLVAKKNYKYMNIYCVDCIKEFNIEINPAVEWEYYENQHYENQHYEQDETEQQEDELVNEDECLGCGGYSVDGGICYYCRVER